MIQEFDSKLLLGRYRVVRLLAEGGMGKVYLARAEGAEGFKRPVVVKVLRLDTQNAEQGHRLFKREAQILSRMQHPSIANIIDYGIEDGAHIMVLEYVHGYAVSHWLDFRHVRRLRVPVDICLYIIRRVLDALHYAHHFAMEDGTQGEIVHRDVAADNVLLDNKGYVYLLDFGIASIGGKQHRSSTSSGIFRGKLGYAAPETLGGTPATPRSDQYSAASLLWELLTLETPFQSETAGETVTRMMNEPLDPISSRRSDTPAQLDVVLGRALSKNPEGRYESVRDFSRELRKLQSEDDEEIAQHLKSLVEVDFDLVPQELPIEALHSREEALSRAIPATTSEAPALPPGGSRPRPELSMPDQADAPNARSLRTLLLGLFLVGALTALGLGAVIALLQDPQDEQVVVVGGENPEPQKSSDTGSEPHATAPAKKPAPVSPEEGLSEAIQSQGAEFESCFVTHLEVAEKMPEAKLHFSVPAGGSQATVAVEPPTLADSSLGKCLKQAASRVRFPPQQEAISFRVPLTARFARIE